MSIGLPGDDPELRATFVSHIPPESPFVVELGTKRWDPNRPTAHRDWFDETAQYHGVDIEPGTDVDVVADAHLLADFYAGTIDALLAVSVLEHLERPWVATDEFAKAVAPGGVVYVDTHQSFPLHGYPHDFWRFTLEGLHVLFPDDGWEWLAGKYHGEALVCPKGVVDPWNEGHEAWLNVGCVVKRRKP